MYRRVKSDGELRRTGKRKVEVREVYIHDRNIHVARIRLRSHQCDMLQAETWTVVHIISFLSSNEGAGVHILPKK